MTSGIEPVGNGAKGAPRPSPPRLIFNPISVAGVAVAAVGATGSIFFLVTGLFSSHASGYLGLLLVPPLLVTLAGLGLIPFGVFRERIRRGRGDSPSFTRDWSIELPRLTRGRAPAILLVATMIGTLGILAVGAGSIQLMEFTESNTFCGTVCHAVMSPEATAYPHAAHAKIPCVNCHVGEGIGSFLQAKLNGSRQLLAVVTGDFSRPIPTPIAHRRPSRDMCESCHWPDRFIDYKALTRTYFLDSEENEATRLRMLMKVGGGANDFSTGSGIHYHMTIAHKVEYIARDEQRQQIPWVRVTHQNGTIEEYDNSEEPLSEEERQALESRVMECVDCHSRPAHPFISPVASVNGALESGVLSRKLPHIKVESVRALDGGYETTEEAMQGIAESLSEFYQENYPEALNNGSRAELEASIDALQRIYRRTIFPEMQADWTTHPDNIGHRDSQGCFRCHNDEMENQAGEPMGTKCSTCHVILAQGEDVAVARADFENGRAFDHPEDGDPFDEFTYCTECHNGGIELYE